MRGENTQFIKCKKLNKYKKVRRTSNNSKTSENFEIMYKIRVEEHYISYNVIFITFSVKFINTKFGCKFEFILCRHGLFPDCKKHSFENKIRKKCLN